MAGLLNYTPDPVGMGLLNAGAALMTPRAMGGGVGAGLLGFNQGMMQAQMMRRQQAQDALREQLAQAQISEAAAQSDERKSRAALLRQKADEDAAARAKQDQFWQMLSGGNDAVMAQTGGLAPTNANAAMRNQPMQMTPELAMAAARAGIPLDTLKSAASAGDWGRAKVSREVTVAGPDGSPVTLLMDDFGRPVGQALPQAVKRELAQTGGALVPVNPFTIDKPLPITMSAAERDASARGWAGNALARERFNFDKAQAAGGGADGGIQYITTPTGIVAVPKKPGADGAIAARPVVDAAGQAVGGANNQTTQQKIGDATDALALIRDAEKLIDKSTGSYLGTGVDLAARAFGASTSGAEAAAQLKAIEGALIAKMPKMSGPQSDKDVMLYRQMAGQVGDATLPAATKKAALETIKGIQRRYAGVDESAKPDAPSAAGMPMNLQELARQELARRNGAR